MESSSNQNILREEYVLPIYKSSDRDNSVEREVIVKFLDTSNEEKYERLVKEEKIKTPLKRKLPSPNNSISQNDCNQDNGKQSMKKSRSDRNNTPDSSTDGTDGTDDFHDSREVETNQEILARRQKQIDYGKNTIGYETYTKLVPKYEKLLFSRIEQKKNKKKYFIFIFIAETRENQKIRRLHRGT